MYILLIPKKVWARATAKATSKEPTTPRSIPRQPTSTASAFVFSAPSPFILILEFRNRASKDIGESPKATVKREPTKETTSYSIRVLGFRTSWSRHGVKKREMVRLPTVLLRKDYMADERSTKPQEKVDRAETNFFGGFRQSRLLSPYCTTSTLQCLPSWLCSPSTLWVVDMNEKRHFIPW